MLPLADWEGVLMAAEASSDAEVPGLPDSDKARYNIHSWFQKLCCHCRSILEQ